MTKTNTPPWLQWAREIQSLSQTGLAYAGTDYETSRYRRLMEIAADIVHTHTRLPKEPVLENFFEQPGYATAKVDVRGAAIRDGKILLVQERTDQRWCMPGGWADVGELPSEMVIREVWEESGFEVIPRRVVGVYDANRGPTPMEFFHAYKIVFLCEITDGQARPSDETSAVDFFSFNDLPLLSPHRTNERHHAEVQAHLRDSKCPVAFD